MVDGFETQKTVLGTFLDNAHFSEFTLKGAFEHVSIENLFKGTGRVKKFKTFTEKNYHSKK